MVAEGLTLRATLENGTNDEGDTVGDAGSRAVGVVGALERDDSTTQDAPDADRPGDRRQRREGR